MSGLTKDIKNVKQHFDAMNPPPFNFIEDMKSIWTEWRKIVNWKKSQKQNVAKGQQSPK